MGKSKFKSKQIHIQKFHKKENIIIEKLYILLLHLKFIVFKVNLKNQVYYRN